MHDCPKQAAGETLFLLIFQLTSFSPVSWWKLCLSYLLLVTSLTLCSNMVIRIWVTKSASWQIIARHTYRKFLCVATDLVVGTIMDPVSVAFHTSKGLQLNIVDIKILHILYFILCTASILILMALTVDRYAAVSSPVKYKTMVTSKRAILTSLLIWLAALGFSFTYFQLGFIFYSFIFANTAVLSTCGVLIFVHVGILKRLRQRSRYWRKRG